MPITRTLTVKGRTRNVSPDPPSCNENSTTPILNPISVTQCGKKLFFGCHVRGWTKAISLFQIVIGVGTCGHIFGQISSAQTNISPLLVSLSVIALALGFILLVGVYYKKRECLFTWLVLTGFGLAALVLILLALIYAFLFFGTTPFVLWIILVVLITFGVNYLAFRIVSSYRKELSFFKKMTPTPTPAIVEYHVEEDSSDFEKDKEYICQISRFLDDPLNFDNDCELSAPSRTAPTPAPAARGHV